jgi:hypothetical protein
VLNEAALLPSKAVLERDRGLLIIVNYQSELAENRNFGAGVRAE